ncbi:MAG: hypothetical protein M1449_10265 [Candidatus Thermoplasmatota archaeon]|nr:hypothetical protein [Candidatus Thermoplasmatota archaeon]
MAALCLALPAAAADLPPLSHSLTMQAPKPAPALKLVDTPIQHRLADWRYESAGQPPRAIRSKTGWERLWKRLGVAESARIAFTWAQFPATQTFAPGDWNQGMTSYSVPRGGRFDLRFAWRAGGKTHTGTLEQVKCADERS